MEENIKNLHMIFKSVKEGDLTVLESLTEDVSNNKELITELCAQSKYCLLYAGKKLQQSASFVVPCCHEDYDFAFWVCSNSPVIENNKIDLLKKVIKEPMCFFEFESKFLDDEIFVKISREFFEKELENKPEELKKPALSLFDRTLKVAKMENEHSKKKETEKLEMATDPIEKIKQKRFDKITNMLIEIGTPTHLAGFKYIREGVLLALDNEDFLIKQQVVSVFYPKIGEKFNSSGPQVDRGIRHTLDCIYAENQGKEVNKLFKNMEVFGKHGKHPTSKQFITIFVEKIKQDEREAEYHATKVSKAIEAFNKERK